MHDYACRHNFTWTSCSRAKIMQQWPPLQAGVLCNRHCARSTCMSYTWRVLALSSRASRPEWSFDDALQGSRKHSGQRVAETRYRYRSWLTGRRDPPASHRPRLAAGLPSNTGPRTSPVKPRFPMSTPPHPAPSKCCDEQLVVKSSFTDPTC